jgi:hypothetical protein
MTISKAQSLQSAQPKQWHAPEIWRWVCDTPQSHQVQIEVAVKTERPIGSWDPPCANAPCLRELFHGIDGCIDATFKNPGVLALLAIRHRYGDLVCTHVMPLSNQQ